MANICDTYYRIKGDRATLQKIADAINSDDAVVENTIPCWAGNTLAALNLPHDNAGRCWWYEANIDYDGVLSFWEEGAWTRGNAISVLNDKLPEIEITFKSEEFGCGIYETNDIQGDYFADKFVIDSDELGILYYSTFDDLVSYVSEHYPDVKGCKDIDELNDYFNEKGMNSTVYRINHINL